MNQTSFYLVSTNKHFERFFYEFILGNLVYLYLFIMIIKRYLKNREIADLKKKRLAGSIKNKMFLITIFLLLKLSAIIAAFYCEDFWLYDINDCSFLYIFQILVLLIEIFMMKFEYMKTIPYTWYLHHLFWILISILQALYLLNTVLIQCENQEISQCFLPNLIFDGLFLVISSILTFYNLIVKFQDLPDFEMLWNTGSRANLLGNFAENPNNNNLFSMLNQRLTEEIHLEEPQKQKKLKFKASIKNKLINNNNRVFFQINVELSPQKSLKIFKTVEDFVKLDQNIQESRNSLLFSGNSPVLPKLNFQKPENAQVFSSEFFLGQRAVFENYLKVFLENELFPLALLDFLEIKEPFKTKCIEVFHQKFLIKDQKFQDFEQEEEKEERSVSISSVVLTESNALNPLNIEKNQDSFLKTDEKAEQVLMKKRFCVYFNVQMKEWNKEQKSDYFSFVFQLSLVEKPEEMWRINKRYSDFIRLDQELRKVLKRKLPELPEKKLLLDTNILNTRGKKLAKYLRTLLNEKVYFHSILFEFIKLSNENYEILMNTQFSLMDPSLYNAKIMDHTVIIDNQDKQPYTAYIVRITKFLDKHGKNIDHQHDIVKRFSDFERLHKVLLIRFGKLKGFPGFPSKLPSFLPNETIVYRKNALEKYVNELFKVENIDDSVAFRKFLNVDPKEKGNFIMNVSNLQENEELLANSGDL